MSQLQKKNAEGSESAISTLLNRIEETILYILQQVSDLQRKVITFPNTHTSFPPHHRKHHIAHFGKHSLMHMITTSFC